MISVKEVDVVGFKRFTSKSGNECLIIYWMGDPDQYTQGLMAGQIFAPGNITVKAKDRIKIAYTGKGWEYVG